MDSSKKAEAAPDQKHVLIITAANQGLCAKGLCSAGDAVNALSIELHQREASADNTHKSQY